MENETKTDATYELIEHLEAKEKKLSIMAIGSLLLAPLGLIGGAFSYVAIIHQKGNILDQQMIPIAIVYILLISIILIFGIIKYSKLKKYNHRLSKIRLLEETIYNEVLKAKIN